MFLRAVDNCYDIQDNQHNYNVQIDDIQWQLYALKGHLAMT